jgi:hypothetical protein
LTWRPPPGVVTSQSFEPNAVITGLLSGLVMTKGVFVQVLDVTDDEAIEMAAQVFRGHVATRATTRP